MVERLLACVEGGSRSSEVAAPAHTPGYQAAVDAGADVRARIMAAPEMVNSIELARRMGVTRETVNQKRQKGTLLALPRLLRVFGELDLWTQYLFITQRNPALDAASPLDALRSGEQARVLATAADYAELMAPA